MPGFMEGYGEAEARRNRLILRIGGTLAAAAILGAAGYFYFRTWSEEQVFARFKETLARQDYEAAYRMWCTAEKPCPYYPIEKFKADWAPPSPYANLDAARLEHVDYCGSGVVFSLAAQDADPVAVWVDRTTKIMSFYPYPRCPGKRLQFGPLLRRIFGSAEKTEAQSQNGNRE